MRTVKVLTVGLVVGAVGMSAFGQNATPTAPKPAQTGQPGDRPGGGGPGGEGRGRDRGGWGGAPLAPEKAKAAWELQAKGVAKRLGVSDDKAQVIVKAYTETRQSLSDAQEKMREEMRKAREDGKQGDGGAGGAGGDGDKPPPDGGGQRRGGGRAGMGEAFQKMEELNTKEREKLQKTIGAAISPVMTDKAMASLGTFNRQWDAMTDAVAGFGLEGKKLQEAQSVMEDWVVTQGKFRPQGRGPGGGGGGGDDNAGGGDQPDREAMMKAMQDSRKALMDSMKKILSDEQFKKFEATLPQRGGRGGGQRGDRRDGPPDAGGGGGERF